MNVNEFASPGMTIENMLSVCGGPVAATDPLLPDDIFMGNVGFLIRKLTATVTWAPAADRPIRPIKLVNMYGRYRIECGT